MVYLRAHLRFEFSEQLKMHKNVKRDAFYATVDDPLDCAVKGCL